MFVETTKEKRAVIHEGYLYQKIRDNDSKSWLRCQDRSCNGRLCMDNAIVINVSGVHHYPPNMAKITAQTVTRKMRKRAIEETTSIPKIYAQELAAVSGYEGVELSEIAINLPQFPVIKSSLYRGRMTKYPSLPQTIQDITFVGDWTRTIQGEDMLLADSGDNHPERIIIFSTKKNLEILCNSDCIYLDGTFKSCPDLFYQLITLHAFVERK